MNNIFTKCKPAILLYSSLCALSISYAQSETVWDGVYSSVQAERGEGVYNNACISCHGKDLGGNSNSPGLVGMGFMFLWEGRTLGEFFEKIREEMPTDRPGQLPVQDYVDVIAYIMKANSFPAGDRELPLEVEALTAIAIAPKP